MDVWSAGGDEPVPGTASLLSTTDRLAVVNRHGRVIRGLIHEVPEPRGVVVVMPGLGMPLRRTLGVALNLVAAGFTVVRFTPTDSEGESEGTILDFTVTGAFEDLADLCHWAVRRFGVSGLGVYATSIAGRAAIRVAARFPGLLRAVVGTGCVVDVGSTLHDIGGEDVVGNWRRDRGRTDPDDRGLLFGRPIRVFSLERLVEDGWADAEGTAAELAGATRTRFLDFHGADDPWVRTEEVRAAFGAARDAEVVVVPEAGHHLDPAGHPALLSRLIRTFRSALDPDGRDGPHRPGPSAAEYSTQRRLDSFLLRTAGRRTTDSSSRSHR